MRRLMPWLCAVALCAIGLTGSPRAEPADAGATARAEAAAQAHLDAAVAALEAGDPEAGARHLIDAIDGLSAAGLPLADYADAAVLATYAALSVGGLDEAIRFLRMTATLPAAALTDEAGDLSEMALDRIEASVNAAEPPAVLALLDAALSGPGAHLEPDHPHLFRLRALRGGLAGKLRMTTEALADLDAALAAIPPAADPHLVAASFFNRAQLLTALDRDAAAIASLDALRPWLRAPGFDPDVRLHIVRGRVAVLDGLSREADAGRAAAELRALLAESLGPDHPDTLRAGCRGDTLLAEAGAPGDSDACERLVHTLERGLGPHLDVADALVRLGRAHHAAGRPVGARSALDAAVDLQSALPADPETLASTLRRRAAVHLALGDADRAEDDMLWGVALIDAGDDGRRAMWLHDLAAVATQRSDYAAASRRLDDALAVARSPFERMAILFGRAIHHDDTDAPDAAAPLYAEALALLDADPDTAYAGYWRIRAAVNAHARGEPEAAARLARQALVETEARTAMPHRWRILSHYAALAAEREDNTVAIFYTKQVVAALQAIRGGLDEADAFIDAHRGQYEMLTGMLVQRRGRLAEADVIDDLLDHGRLGVLTRGLRDAPGGVPQTAAELAWRARYDAARRQLQAAPADRAARDTFLAALDALEADMRTAEAEGARGPAFDAGDVMQNAQPWLAALDRQRSGKAALVQWFSDAEIQLLLITTADAHFFVMSETTRDELNARAGELARALSGRGDGWRPLAEGLYTDFIAHVREALADTGVDTLLWSLDGALRYVPLAALVDPETGRFLIQDYAMARYIAPDPDAPAARRPVDRVAAFGAAGAVPGTNLPPLPSVPFELTTIVQPPDAPAMGLLPGRAHLDAEFTADALLSTLAAGATPAIHIASHFVFRPGPADRSFLALGDGDTLGLDRLSAVRFDGVELLTLSACQTAVGTFAEGQPLDGFAALAIRQGARSVVASLWPVADDSTARLMARFYARLAQGDHKIDALRAAQVAMLGATGRGPARKLGLPGPTPQAPAGPHPYTWAPFILIGDPR